MSKVMLSTALALITVSYLISRESTAQTTSSVKEAQSEKLPYYDEVKGVPVGGYGHKARNVWKPVCQTLGAPYEKGTKKLSLRCSAPVPSHEKKILNQEAYDRWRTIESPTLTPDGRWAIYTLRTAAGDGELVVRSTSDSEEIRVPVAAKRAPESWDDFREMVRGRGAQVPVQVSADSRFVFFAAQSPVGRSNVPRREDSLRRVSQGALGILKLQDGDLMVIPNVSSFSMSGQSGRFVAYLMGKREDEDPKRQVVGPLVTANSETLVIHDLAGGSRVRIPDVRAFRFDDSGRYLAYVVASEDADSSGVFVRRLSDGASACLLAGSGEYRSLTFDESGRQFAFLAGHVEQAEGRRQYSIYYSAVPLKAAVAVVSERDLEEHSGIAPETGLGFTRAGNALTFRIAPANLDSNATTVEVHRDNVTLDLWSWREPQSPVSNGLRDGSIASQLAVYHIAERKLVRIGRQSIDDVVLSDNGRQAVGVRSVAPQVDDRWGQAIADVYLIDGINGKAELLRRIRPSKLVKPFGALVNVSPSGRYMVYFEDRRWWSLDLKTKALVDLTGELLPGAKFDSENAVSRPDSAPEGIAAWTQGRERLLLYGRRDIWEVDPSGHARPVNLTGDIGSRENIVFRLWRDYSRALSHPDLSIEPLIGADGRPLDQHPVDTSRPLLLVTLNKNTMASGVWRTGGGTSRMPEKLLMLDKRIKPIAKARHAEQYLLSMETFSEFPDLWAGERFDQLTKISNANPQQREFKWGNAELVEFTSDFGVPLKGVLYKPSDFNPSKKYPMIVNIYERWSQHLHKYYVPQPATSADSVYVSPSFVSKDYVLFQPDIESNSPYPGEGALAAVTAGVQAVLDRGFVDAARIGLSGHSFGGYEVAYILTRTNLFRCAIDGAGVSNTISAYGTSKMTIGASNFEYGQNRHGGSIWRNPFVYFINSPVLYADRVKTPLMMLHNADDSVVPVEQSLEFFIALSRNAKEVYLFNYRNERHILINGANRNDWSERMHEFFDYFLQEGPMPEWMNRGKGATISPLDVNRHVNISPATGLNE